MNSLFKLLVLGGAAMTAQIPFASESSAPANPTLTEAFCSADNPEICVAAVVDGKCGLGPKAGLQCCWATTCE